MHKNTKHLTMSSRCHGQSLPVWQYFCLDQIFSFRFISWIDFEVHENRNPKAYTREDKKGLEASIPPAPNSSDRLWPCQWKLLCSRRVEIWRCNDFRRRRSQIFWNLADFFLQLPITGVHSSSCFFSPLLTRKPHPIIPSLFYRGYSKTHRCI